MAFFDIFGSEQAPRNVGARYSLALQKSFCDDAPKLIGAPRRTSVDVAPNASIARFATSEDELNLYDVLSRKLERISLIHSKAQPEESADGLLLPRKPSKNRKFQKIWVGTFCKASNAKGFSPCMMPDPASSSSRPSSRRGSGFFNKVSKVSTVSPSTFSSLVGFSTVTVEPSLRTRRSLNSAKNGSICYDNSAFNWSALDVDPSQTCRRSFNSSSRNGSMCIEEASVRSSAPSSSSACRCGDINETVGIDSTSCCSSQRPSAQISENMNEKGRRRRETNSSNSPFCVLGTPAMVGASLSGSRGFLPSFRIKQTRHGWSTCSTSTCSTPVHKGSDMCVPN